MNENPETSRSAPAVHRAAAVPRILAIAALLFFPYWAVGALLEGTWEITFANNESRRHFLEWWAIFLVSIFVVYAASIRPAFGPLHRLFNWLLSARILRRVFIAAAWILTLVVLLYAEENWRGARAWNNYRRELEAAGAQLDLAAYIPKPVPDGQNFAASAIVKSWFVEIDRTVFTNTTERFAKNWNDNYEQIVLRFPDTNDHPTRIFMDLAAWGKAFDILREGGTNALHEFGPGRLDLASRAAAVPAVLAGLKTNELALAELQIASARPLCRYPVFYDLDNPWGIFLPHLRNFRDACRRLQLRACAELAAGRSEDALADVNLMFYLADSVKDEPFLISYLVRLACMHFAVQPVWEGCAEHVWTDAQLQQLETRLARINLVADLKRSFDSERASGILTTDLIRKKGLGMLIELIGPGSPSSADRKFANWCGGLIPGGWYHLEQLNFCRFQDALLDGAFDTARKRVSPGRMEANQREIDKVIPGEGFGRTAGAFLHHRIIASLMLSSLPKILLKAACAQTAADQAALACALERFRLANRAYPGSLEALAPALIPQSPTDVITGKPFRYRRTDDAQYVLYSVGWNEKDDGGVPGTKLFDEKQGDWVWQFPAK